MAIFKVWVETGYVNCGRNDEIEIDDDELNECETQQAKDDLIEEYFNEWLCNNIDMGWHPIDE